MGSFHEDFGKKSAATMEERIVAVRLKKKASGKKVGGCLYKHITTYWCHELVGMCGALIRRR